MFTEKNERRTSNVEWEKMRNRNGHSSFDIGYLETNEIKLRSGATSLFDVQRWTFNVRRSSFKPTLYGIKITRECLPNDLALMNFRLNPDEAKPIGVALRR